MEDPPKPKDKKDDPEYLARKRQQWDLLTPDEKKRTGATWDTFVETEDHTGYGPNAIWTDPEDVLKGL